MAVMSIPSSVYVILILFGTFVTCIRANKDLIIHSCFDLKVLNSNFVH